MSSMTSMTRVSTLLIISPDVVDSHMAGPGIRSWEIARALAGCADITLAIPNKSSLSDPGIHISTYGDDAAALRRQVDASEVILIQGFILHKFPFLKECGKPLIVDVYDPFVIENLEVHSFRTMPERRSVHNRDLAVQVEQLKVGDFFICANERQRDYWLGMLSASGRINPYNYRLDKSLRKLIDVVPFGLPGMPPKPSKGVLRGRRCGIAPSDKLVIWGGGIWAWLDPLTMIRAMKIVCDRRQDVKLFFLGREHPNPEISAVMGSGLYSKAVTMSKDLGLYDRFVFFNDEWVPYDERHNYLLEADVGVCLHQNLVEMRYASRTRLLDYIWCGLPIITSRGDSWSEIVERFKLGKTVAQNDVEQVVAAIDEMISVPNLRAELAPRFDEVRGELTWQRAVRPLMEFLASPRRAPDILAGGG